MQPSALIVSSFVEGAPLERYVSGELAGRLAARGWRIIITSRKRPRLARWADMLQTTWRRRRDYTVALIDVFSGPAFSLAETVCWMLRRLGKPYVLTLHGGNLPAFAQRWPGRVRTLLGGASAVTVPSPYLHHQLRPYRRELLLLPNPLGLEQYPFFQRESARPDIIWVRAFHQVYNPTLAVRTLARLTSRFPAVRLTMIGPDKADGSLKETRRLAGQLGVAAHLRLLGPIRKHDIPHWLSRHDLFLNTATVDNTPVSVLEALACGLGVVSTRVGGIPYLLEDQQSALLVPPRDPDAMAAAVMRLLSEPALTAHLCRQGRRRVEAFDWSLIGPRWEHLLQAAAAGRSPEPGEPDNPSELACTTPS